MKKIILLLSAVLLWALPVSVSAQNKNNDKAKQQRKEQFDRFCKFRRDFMMKQNRAFRTRGETVLSLV